MNKFIIFFLLVSGSLFPTPSVSQEQQQGIIATIYDNNTARPLKGIEVKAHMSKGKFHAHDTTDKNGEVKLHLKPGNYFLIANLHQANTKYLEEWVKDIQVVRGEFMTIKVYLKYSPK